MIPLWAIKLGALGAAALALFSAGAYSHMRWTEAEAAEASLQASEQARKDERDNSVSTIRRMDAYSVTAAQNQVRALAARSDADSVRHSLAAIASAAPASAYSADPRLAGIADLLSEGVGLAEEGARHVEELRAQRDALR